LEILPTFPDRDHRSNPHKQINNAIGGGGTSLGDGLAWNFGTKGMLVRVVII